jgi:tight adherence protein B
VAGNNFFIMSVLVFVAVVLLLEGLYLLWRGHRGPQAVRLRERLRAIAEGYDAPRQAHAEKQRPRELRAVQSALTHMPLLHSLELMLAQSGLGWPVSKVLVMGAGCTVVAALVLVGMLHQSLPIGLVGALLAAWLPMLVVQYARKRRLDRIERQLPDALDLLARGLRAGHAFSATLKMAGDELPDPIGAEFRAVHDEINFGVSLPEALTHLGERVPGTEVRYFVVAVMIQREAGGNLTEILANLSRLVRERLKLQGRVRVLSSEGRMSAWILTLLPFALAGMMTLFNPKFMTPLWTDPIGIAIVKYMLILMLVGVIILRRIIRVRF